MLFFCILNSLPPCSGVLVSEKVVAQSRSLSYGRVILGNFREFLGPILLEIYGHFMGHFLRCSFTLFCGAVMDDFFFMIFKAVLTKASFMIEVPLIWFPFSISNNGFLNT